MKADDALLCIRVPQSLKSWLSEQARQDERSLATTVTRMLRKEMEQQKAAQR